MGRTDSANKCREEATSKRVGSKETGWGASGELNESGAVHRGRNLLAQKRGEKQTVTQGGLHGKTNPHNTGFVNQRG